MERISPAGQVRTEAEVLAVAAKGEVVVRVAADVELVGIREDLFVAIRRGIPDDNRIALANLLAVQFKILCGRALELNHD